MIIFPARWGGRQFFNCRPRDNILTVTINLPIRARVRFKKTAAMLHNTEPRNRYILSYDLEQTNVRVFCLYLDLRGNNLMGALGLVSPTLFHKELHLKLLCAKLFHFLLSSKASKSICNSDEA